MQVFSVKNISKLCAVLLSLSLLPQLAFGFDNQNLAYLDSSDSYLQSKVGYSQNILDLNSPESQGYEASIMIGAKPVIVESNEKVNLSLRNADILQSLRMLADKANVNIAFDSDVEGTITIDLKCYIKRSFYDNI